MSLYQQRMLFDKRMTSQLGSSSPSGWDNVMSGVKRAAGSFITGLSAGLKAADPNRPYASFGAALGASTPGIQAEFMAPVDRYTALQQAETQSMVSQAQAPQRAALAEEARANRQADLRAEQETKRALSQLSPSDVAQAAIVSYGGQPFSPMSGIATGVGVPGTPQPEQRKRMEIFDAQIYSPPPSASSRVLELLVGKTNRSS